MFKQLLHTIGYTNNLNYKDKVAYPLALIAVFTASAFLISYHVYVKFIPAIIAHYTYIALNLCSIFFMKNGRFFAAKNIILTSHMVQLTLAVFVWYPIETGFNFIYILTPVAVFLMYNYDCPIERKIATFTSVASVFLYLLSASGNLGLALHSLPAEIMYVYKMVSIGTALFPTVFVLGLASKELSRLHQELKHLANTDGLTRILNRRAFYEQASHEFYLAEKYQHSFSLILIDIDHFKYVNDQYGHDAGDKVLIELSNMITSKTRKHDLFCRYGGEEFALLFKNTTLEEAKRIGNTLLELIRQHIFEITPDVHLNITISMGLSQYSKDYESLDELIKSADTALYKAKSEGRNCMIF